MNIEIIDLSSSHNYNFQNLQNKCFIFFIIDKNKDRQKYNNLILETSNKIIINPIDISGIINQINVFNFSGDYLKIQKELIINLIKTSIINNLKNKLFN